MKYLWKGVKSIDYVLFQLKGFTPTNQGKKKIITNLNGAFVFTSPIDEKNVV